VVNSQLQQNLYAWAADRSDPTSIFVKELASGLGSVQDKKLWAFVNIRQEFDALVEDPEDLAPTGILTAFRSFARNLLPILYVLPILVTWSELALAIRSYRQAVRNSPSETVDFLAVWAKADGDHFGLGFQTAALIIAGSIALIVLAHVTNWWTTRTIRNAGLARLREANSLLLAAQLQLVKSRAVTPEEMADSLTAAGSLLQEALLEVSEVLPRFEGISTGLEKVVSGLANASQSLDTTSKFIRQSTDALEDLPTRIEPLLDVLRDAPAAMQSTLDEFLTATAEATQTNQNTATAAQRLAQNTSNLAGEVSAIGRQLNDVAAKVTETMSFVASLPQSLGDHAQVAVELSRSLESATPVAIVFKEGSEQLSESVKQLAAMVSELREAANRYRDSGGDASGRY